MHLIFYYIDSIIEFLIFVRATCNTCKKKLELLKVSPEEFENLKKEFFKSVVIGKNVFSKSTPAEVKRFEEFIEKMDKFDVVVDGLNVAYLVGSKQPASVTSGFVSTTPRFKIILKLYTKIIIFKNNEGEFYFLRWLRWWTISFDKIKRF